MQHATDRSATSSTPQTQDSGTGPGAKATTPEAALREFTLASLQYLEAQARCHDAVAMEYAHLALCHSCDPHLTASDRMALEAVAMQRAENAKADARAKRQRAAALRQESGIGQGALPAASSQDATAVIVISVQHDRIRQLATLHMGAALSASREWTRIGVGSWKTLEPEFVEHEDRIGLELAEFADAITLPSKVANMLPRRRSAGTDAAAAAAAEEVRRG